MQITRTIGMVAGLRPVFRLFTLLVLSVIASIQTVRAAQADLSDEDMARLERGEILLQTIHADKAGAAARVTALFHSNASAVWQIIGYCKYELIYMRGLKVCEMLDGDQFQMTMFHRLRNSWYTPTLDFTFEAKREPGGNGQAHLIDGDLKVLEGAWKFFPSNENHSVIVIHEVRIQPKMPAPKWLVRRSLRNDLPDMLACIRGLADASGDHDRKQVDLERCPGDISELSE